MIFQTHCPYSFAIDIQSGAIVISEGCYELNRNTNWYSWKFSEYEAFLNTLCRKPAIVIEEAKKKLKSFLEKYPSYDVYKTDLHERGCKEISKDCYFNYPE
jgi:hypothetical protein